MKRNTKKIVEEKVIEKPCMCETHIKMDKERSSALPCVGHGIGCPCTELLLNPPKDEEVKEEQVSSNPQVEANAPVQEKVE